MQRNETYQNTNGTMFRIERVNKDTVLIKEVGGIRLVNRWLLEQDIKSKQVKLKGKGEITL